MCYTAVSMWKSCEQFCKGSSSLMMDHADIGLLESIHWCRDFPHFPSGKKKKKDFFPRWYSSKLRKEKPDSFLPIRSSLTSSYPYVCSSMWEEEVIHRDYSCEVGPYYWTLPLRDFLLLSLPSPNQIHLLLSGRDRVSSVTLDSVFIDQQPIYKASIYCFNESVWMTSRNGFQVISWTGTIWTRQIKMRFLVCQMWF